MKITKLIALLTLSVMTLSASASYSAEKTSINISINDYILPLPHEAFMVNGTPMATMYDICKPLRMDTEIKGDIIRIYREKIGADMTFTLNSATAVISGEECKLSAAPYADGDQYYIPLDAFCRACEYDMTIENDMVKIYTTTQEILKWLKRYDEFAGKEALDFVLHQYDPETGGFYFAPSTRDTEGYGTDIESTEQALSFLSAGKPQGWYDDKVGSVLPQKFKDKITTFAQSRQDPEDGYFYNEWQGHDVGTQKRERDLSRGVALAGWWGEGPLYPLPSERIAQAQASGDTSGLSTAYDFVKSEEAFLAWLNSFDWQKNAYNAGSTAASSIATIRAAGLEMTAVEFFKSIQNSETGLWGDGYTYDATNAAMKIGCFFTTNTEPYPNMRLMVDSVIKTMKGDDEPETICEIWNPLFALIGATDSYGPLMDADLRAYLNEQLPELMEITYKNLIQFKQKDGGTSYYKSGSRVKHHGSVIGLGLKESDMDAAYIGTLQIRAYLYNLARFSFIPPVYEPYKDYIYNYFETARPVQKKKTQARELEDMENAEGTRLPSGFTATTNVGSVETAADPLDENNKVIKINTVSGGLTALAYSVSSSENTKKVTFECDLYVESLGKGSTFYNPIGNYGLQWCITSTDGRTFDLTTRPNQTGTGITYKQGLAMGKWHRIKIVYEPDGKNNTLTNYFVNGKLCKRSTAYFYDNDPAREPQKDIKTVGFKSFTAAIGTLYIDNLSVKID